MVMCSVGDDSQPRDGSSMSPDSQTLYSDFQPPSITMTDRHYQLPNGDTDFSRILHPNNTSKTPIIHRRLI
jgi:hypothetical protein